MLDCVTQAIYNCLNDCCNLLVYSYLTVTFIGDVWITGNEMVASLLINVHARHYDFNRFSANCSKLLLFIGFSAILV